MSRTFDRTVYNEARAYFGITREDERVLRLELKRNGRTAPSSTKTTLLTLAAAISLRNQLDVLLDAASTWIRLHNEEQR